jgi:biotin transport system substrate-specific component
VYLLAGACGLPVFAGGMGGIGRMVGPTGGYLVGYLPAVFIIGTIAEKGKSRIAWDIIGMLTGTIVLYACGVTWLKTLTGMPWLKTLAVGMFPFLIGDTLKIIAAAAIARALRPIIRVARSPKPATQIS